jgi:hypothetical protein
MQVYGFAFTNADAAGANPVTSRQLAHGFVRQHDTAFHHQLFDVPLAQAEAEVQPHTVADDLPRKSVAFVGIAPKFCGHATEYATEG